MAKSDNPGGTLFPMFHSPTAPSSKGLAALAEAAKDAAERHEIVFKLLTVRSILNKTVSKRRLSLAYSINPYRGCEFGCRYCYARYTHTFFSPKNAEAEAGAFSDPSLFERLVFLKENAAWLLEQELRRIDPAEEIAIGTATDPYQPVERTALITQSLLRVFARRKGHRIGIVTKSDLIARDIGLLTEIAKHNTLVVHVTVTTPDARLARLLEPRAPRPDLRLAAVEQLRASGINTGVLCSPLLPGITDSEEQIDTMARLVHAANASFFAAEPLFLKPCSRPTFLSFVREHFPKLETDYAGLFAVNEFADRSYRDQLQSAVAQSCRRYGIAHRSTDALLTRDAGQATSSIFRFSPAQQNLFQ